MWESLQGHSVAKDDAPNLLTRSGMSSAPRTDGPTSPDGCELRAHIFPLILSNKEVLSFLTSLEPQLVHLVQNRLTLPTWMPHEKVQSRLDEKTEDFLKKLELPCVRGRPSVLLHKLGDFVEKPELQRRVNGVFRPDAPQHAIFINTSGSGKTRLLLEGLCQHWGFYYTSHVDSGFLGSVDLQSAIQSIPEDEKFCCHLPPSTSSVSNDKIAGRIFKRVFLARLLIFHLFIEAMKANTSPDNGFTEGNFIDYRRKWVHFQLQPSFFTKISDPFHDLTHKLSAYLDSELHHLTRDVLDHVRNTLRSSTSSSGCTPLYWIIDEARFAAKEHTDAFRSKDMEPRPVLRPLVQTFTALTSGFDVIILAGTGLSQSDVDDTMTSGVMKESSYRKCYDTGAFDGWGGRSGMSSWVKMFVPPWILEEADRKRLEECMGYWLKGRSAFAFYIYDNILMIIVFCLPVQIDTGLWRVTLPSFFVMGIGNQFSFWTCIFLEPSTPNLGSVSERRSKGRRRI